MYTIDNRTTMDDCCPVASAAAAIASSSLAFCEGLTRVDSPWPKQVDIKNLKASPVVATWLSRNVQKLLLLCI